MGLGAHLEVGTDGVAVITLENGKVNALHPTVIQQLFENLKKAQASSQVKAIVITGANGVFSGGFDISKFKSGGADKNLSANVNTGFLELVETGPKPTVAALSGIALGGGCELAVACNARVATPGTKIGLPELQLGIIPGFGGTQRLPRLVGLQQALMMMLTSSPVKAEIALGAGLVDAVVPPPQLLSKAKAMALDIANLKAPRRITINDTSKIEGLGDAAPILEFARKEAVKRAGPLQHPQLCIDAVEAGVHSGGRAGLQAEAAAFAKAQSLPVHRALVHMFFAQRTTKNVSGVTDKGLKPKKMKVVAVLGGGLMGSGIATALAWTGYTVLLKEINQEFLDGGMKRIKANMDSRVKKKQMTPKARDAAMALVKGTLTYDGFKEADMVIEAAVERLDIKQSIFADLEKACRTDCVLATNTSTINLDLISAKMRNRDRVVGAHFFSPAHVMPLLEIIRTDHSSPQVQAASSVHSMGLVVQVGRKRTGMMQAVLDTLELGLKIKKTPVVVGNCTGFAVNRVFFPYTMAALLLADLGADPYMIDKVGGDVGLHVGKSFIESFPERVIISQLIPLLNEANRLGEKTGAGFYKYTNRKQAPDPALQEILNKSRAAADLSKFAGVVKSLKPQDIINFIFFPVVNEGCRVVKEKIVDKAADLDVASVMAMGFPAPRGGLIFWADEVGASKICSELQKLAAALPPVAGFFEPCDYLKQCAASGSKLADGPGSRSRL